MVPLEELLRDAAVLAVPLLPGANVAPLPAVSAWLDEWEGRVQELEGALGVNLLKEEGRFRRNLREAVGRGQAGAENCLKLLQRIRLLPK